MQTFLQSINPYNKLWKLFAANLAIALFVMLAFFEGWQNGIKYLTLSLIWAYTISITQWVGHVYLNNIIAKKYSWQNETWQRAIYGTLAIVGYGVVAYIAVQMLMMKLIQGSIPEDPLKWMLKSSMYAVSISFGVSLIFTTIGFFKAWKRSLLEAEEFKREMLVYKYESLQNQINPHFLFNSFNVLSDLVYEDQDKAVFFIKKLSKLFRYVLDSRDKELITVKEELKFIESFSYLLQTRFENKLEINIDIDANDNEYIVPMAIQLLVENSVKHNEISSTKPLRVSLKKEGNYIKISNNIQLKTIGLESKKVGLQNLQQQYKYFTDSEVIVENNEAVFSVSIPIIEL